MIYTAKVTEGIHWLGVNDRITPIFERMWPIGKGMAYNSYVIADERSALIDTVCEATGPDLLSRLEGILNGRELHYLVINHMEPDHSGSLPLIVMRWPQVTILGNKQTKKILDQYYPNLAKFEEVAEGTEIDLGQHKIRFHITPWVHWPETMMTYEMTTQTLFSGDVFGSFGALDGGVFDDEFDATVYEDQMRRYYSCIVGKYSKMAQKALAKLAGVEVKNICATHGPIWRENPGWVIGKYDQWSKQEGEKGVVVAVASMYGNTLGLGEYIARQLVLSGVRNVKFYDVSKTHMSYIVSDIWKYSGLVLGTVAYNTECHPAMYALLHELEHITVANKHLGIFGGYSWNGGGVRTLKAFAESSKLGLAAEPVEMYGHASPEVLQQADVLAKTIAEKVLA